MGPLISGKHRSMKISFHLAGWFFFVVAGSPWHIFCPTMWFWMLRTKLSSQGGGDLLMPTFYLSGTWFMFWQRSRAQGICWSSTNLGCFLGIKTTSLLSTAFHCKIKKSKEKWFGALRTNRNRIAFLLFRPFLSIIPVQADYRKNRRASFLL